MRAAGDDEAQPFGRAAPFAANQGRQAFGFIERVEQQHEAVTGSGKAGGKRRNKQAVEQADQVGLTGDAVEARRPSSGPRSPATAC